MLLSELLTGLGFAGKVMSPSKRSGVEEVELRIRAILPEEYQDCYQEVEPTSMGSASLKYGQDGKVAWDDIWDTYCDLAMAGGPPHKGQLLMAASRQEIAAEPERYQLVMQEICRGIKLVTGLDAAPSTVPGWIHVECNGVTAGWLARAIVMENISARCEGTKLYLPARPRYRVEKEIKNVVTAMAKTCHYWYGHVGVSQQRAIGDLFIKITEESPLIQPAAVGHDFNAETDQSLRRNIAEKIHQATGLRTSQMPCDGWLGMVCPTVKSAIWMMRAMVVNNVFARREGTILFVPVNPISDPDGDTVTKVTARVHGFARSRRIL